MTLTEYMLAQHKLQRAMGSPMGSDLGAVKENLFWLSAEIGEASRELQKPWRASQEVQVCRLKQELVDMFQFYINILNELGMTECEFDELWDGAQKKCELRIKEGY